jgi:hypothetical protein
MVVLLTPTYEHTTYRLRPTVFEAFRWRWVGTRKPSGTEAAR